MASVAAHAAVLAGLFLQVPLPAAAPAAVSVELVTMAPAHAPARPVPVAYPHKPLPVPAKPAGARKRARSRSSAHAVAGLIRHAAAAHVPRSAARVKPAKVPSPPVVAAAPAVPPPSATADASAHDMNLVRRHLERFKFYPLSARRRGIGGDVEVAFRLTAGGKAAQVRVLASSGHDILDEAALETVSRAQPFPVDDGQYRVHLRFRSL